MASLKVFTLLLIAEAAVAATAKPDRIAGGSNASIEKYPYVVQVDFLNIVIWSQQCAGSIITSRYVLSTASCFSGWLGTLSFRRVRVGSGTRNSGGQVVAVGGVVPHPDFSSRRRDADIALVQLSETLVFSDVVRPAIIIAGGFPLPDNIPVAVVGWGYLNEQGARPALLQELSTLTSNRDLCAEKYAVLGNPLLTVTETMVCVATRGVVSGACAGDAGGPVVLAQDPQDIVVGLVTFSCGCGNGTFPTVATAVTSYTDWVTANAV